MNFTEPFYARPVVLVTPKQSDNNNKANLSGSRCNAVTAWVEVRNRPIQADVIVYIFAHLHTALRTEGNMLDKN